jgi:hypothetical protein
MLNNVIFICIFLVILIIVYLSFGMKQVVSNVYTLSIYSLIVAGLFFTYVAAIERYIVKSQVETLMDDFTKDYKVFVGTNTGLVHVNNDSVDNLDKKVVDNNNELIKKSFIILSVCCTVGILFCISTWLIIKKFFKKHSFSMKSIVIQNSILLVFVILTELLFFGLVTRNYKTIDINEIKSKIIDTLISLKN